MDEFDKALEDLFVPSTPTETPSANTETPGANNSKFILTEEQKEALKWVESSDDNNEERKKRLEAKKKEDERLASRVRKRAARRTASAAYEKEEKERFKEQLNEQLKEQPEVKKKRSFFSSRRKSAPAGSLNAPVSPLSTPAGPPELDFKKIDGLEWRSFNTWVLDLASGLRDCSSSFNRIVPEESKEFKVEPLKNDETYNPYNPVYVIHYFKDFWDKIKGFYGAEKVDSKVSGTVDGFIRAINEDDKEWEEIGWENLKFSKDSKAEEPELNKEHYVIKAFDGWLEIIKNTIINLQDNVGKKNIEKISESKKMWKKYNDLVKKYNSFVAKQSKIVNSESSKKLLERINKNDRKAQEIATRIVHPIFVDEKFEGSKGSKSAGVLENFLTKQAQKCEAGKASTKYEKLKAILSDAKMIEGAGTLCTRLCNFYKTLISSNRNLVATLLSGHANNIREFSVDSKQLGQLEKEFDELLDGVGRNIDDLGKVYDNVEKAYKDDKSIIGEDHDFIFGKDGNNCWRVYQNENGTEKEIGYIAEVYYKVVKKEDEKQEVNVSLKDPNGGVIPYKGARTYGSVSDYLRGSMGYLSFENNFTTDREIKCHYTDEEGKENSVTFNANGMAIEINRQGKITTVNENSNTFKQLNQAFKGNQLSSTSPQSNLDINNNEKNEGGINMAGDESKEVTGKWTKAKPSGEKSGEDMIGTNRFIENQVRNTLNKYNRFAENYNKFIVKPFALGVLKELDGEEFWNYDIDYWKNRAKGIELDVPENGSWEELRDCCEKIGSMLLPYFYKANNLYEDYNDKHEDVFDFEFLNFDARKKIEKMGKFVGAVDAMVNDLQARCEDLEAAYGKEDYQKEVIKIEAAKRQLIDFVEKYNEFLSSRSEFAKKHMELKDDFNKGILKDYQVDWWDKFEKYELGDLSNIDLVKAQWSMVLADLIGKYLPTGESNSTTKEIFDIGTKFNSAKSNEEKLSILGKYHTEANKLFDKVSAKLIELNDFSERIKNRGSAFEGPKGKESGSANSGANNSRSIDHDLTIEFVNSKILGLTTCVSEYRKFLEKYKKFFDSNTNAATIVYSNLNKDIFNIDTWEKSSTFEVEGVTGNIKNIYQVLNEYRRIAKELINYFNKKGDAGLKHSSKKYVEFIKESDNINFPDRKPFDAGDNSQQQFVSDAVKSLEYMIIDLNDQLAELEKAAANGGEKTSENVTNTNENEEVEQKEKSETTETVDDPKLEEEKELLVSDLGFQAKDQLIKAVEEYDKFVGNYNTLVGKFKEENDLSGLIEKVTKLKEGPNKKVIWLHGGKRNLRPEPGKTFNTIEELNKAWVDLINKLAEYLPEANKAVFSTKANEISRAIINGNGIEDLEKLKLMEKYNKMCGKMLNYTNSVLKRLKRKAEHKGYLKEETAEEKLLKEFVKKYDELLSRGYKIAQTSGNGSAGEKDTEWKLNFLEGHQLYLVDDKQCDVQKRWSNAFKYLIDNVLPEGYVKETFKNELSNIGNIKVSGNSVNKSKVLKKYHELSEELFNETKNELDKLEKAATNGGEKTNENVMNTNENEEAEQKEETKATTEENKGLFSRIKGKASKLVRKGKKVVAHKLDNSEKELDAAQKELKVLDEHAGASGAEGRFVKQSVMDQPEYETFKAVGQIIVNTNTRGNFGKIFDKLKEGPSSAKSLRSKLKVMITDNNIDKWKLEDGKEFEAKVGVLYIGIAYLPSGSKGIEAACKGMSVGGIKENNMDEVYAVNHAMKKFCRDGIVGHALVKKVKDKLGGLVKEDKISKIESQFSTLLKLKREAAKLGGKAKDTAKKAAKKIGKSSVGKAAKSAASSAVKTVSSLPGKFKKSKTTDNTVNQTSAQAPAVNTKSGKKGGSHKGVWKSLRSKLPFGKKGETEENE